MMYLLFADTRFSGMLGRGRPVGSRNPSLASSLPRRLSLQTALLRTRMGDTGLAASTSSTPKMSVPPAAAPKVPQSSTRPSLFLLGQASSTPLTVGKLPKNIQLLQRFFGLLKTNFKDCPPNTAKVTAAAKVAEEVKAVWKHHFGKRVIEGRESDTDQVDNEKKMIIMDAKIREKILDLEKQYSRVEYESQRLQKRKNHEEII